MDCVKRKIGKIRFEFIHEQNYIGFYPAKRIYPLICRKCGYILDDWANGPLIESKEICPTCEIRLISADEPKDFYLNQTFCSENGRSPYSYYCDYRNITADAFFENHNEFLDKQLLKETKEQNSKKAIEMVVAINEEAAIPKCPRCRSKAITTQTKGFRAGKAGLGLLAAGPIGIAAGGIGSGKVINLCANCGYKWEPGE